MLWTLAVPALVLALAACDGPKPPKTSPVAERLTSAEAAMDDARSAAAWRTSPRQPA